MRLGGRWWQEIAQLIKENQSGRLYSTSCRNVAMRYYYEQGIRITIQRTGKHASKATYKSRFIIQDGRSLVGDRVETGRP